MDAHGVAGYSQNAKCAISISGGRTWWDESVDCKPAEDYFCVFFSLSLRAQLRDTPLRVFGVLSRR